MSRTISFVNKIGTFKEVAKKIHDLCLFQNIEGEISVDLPLFIEVSKKRSVEMSKTADKLLNQPTSFDPKVDEYDEVSMLYGRLVDIHDGTFCIGIYPERLYELIRLEQIRVMYLLDADGQHLINGFIRTPAGEDRIAIENAYPMSYKQLYKKEKIKTVDYHMPNQVEQKENMVLVDQVAKEDEIIHMIFNQNIIPLVLEADADIFEVMKTRRQIVLEKNLKSMNHFQELSLLYSEVIQEYENKCYVALSLKYLQRMIESRNKTIFYMLRAGSQCFVQDANITDDFNQQTITLSGEKPVTMRSLCENIIKTYLFEDSQKKKTISSSVS